MATDLLVKVATELQYDYDVPKALLATGTGISSTFDEASLQNIYYINGTQVLVACQTGESTGVESPAWVIEDTLFPSGVTPVVLRTATQADSRIDALCVTSKSNDLWVLKVGVRFPKWVQFANPTGYGIVDVKPAYDTAGNLQVSAVLYAGQNHMMYTIDLASGTWAVDSGIQVVTLNVADFALSGAFSSADDSSKYGYVLACANGIYAVTAATKLRAQKPVASGNWTSVSHAELPYASAMPLVFAIEAQTQLGAYFQAQSNGKFTRIPLFGNTKLQSIKAVLRRASDPPASMDASGNLVPPPSVWIEVFALDVLGNILHLESDMDQEPLLVANDAFASYYSITAWKDPALLASQMTGMVVTSSADGLALVVGVGQDNSLQQWAQDPDTTDWILQKIAIPDTSGATQAVQKSVYYVEVTVFDGNHAPAPGVTAVINAVQYTNINVNGRPATVDSTRSYTANTNATGKLCLTYDAPDSLAASTITLWVQGMGVDERMDVSPSGDIQQRLRTITSAELKAATNQETGQPVINVDDPTRDALVSALNEVMTVFDPSQPTAVPAAAVADPRKYMHPLTPSHLAATRKHHDRSLGHVRGNLHKGVHIEFIHGDANDGAPRLRTHVITDVEAGNKMNELRGLGFSFLKINWGDLFKSIAKKVVQVVTTVFKTVEHGVEALFTVIKDGATFVWNGVANFARQGFDAVCAIFEHVNVSFQNLFGWLGYIINWDDMKHTAESFKTLVMGFQQEGTDWLTNTVPRATDSFFKQLKAGLAASIDAAKVTMTGVTIGSYDSSTSSAQTALTADTGGSKQSLLDNLPSTAMWLLNKILNAGGGDSGYAFASASLTALQSAFDAFAEAANTAGLSQDFEAAVNDFTALFASFSDRNAADGTAFNHLLDLMKDAVNVVIDLIETLVLVFEKLAAVAFKFFVELLNAPVDLPIVSMIFKKVTGTDLTVINSVCYALAVPFTIIYKIVTGETPFQNSNPSIHSAAHIRALSSADARTVTRGVLTLLNAPLDAYQDLLGVAGDALRIVGASGLASSRWLNCVGVVVPMIDAAISYDAVSSGNPMKITAWSVSTAAPMVSIAWLAMTKLQRGPRGDTRGQVILGLLGLSQLGTAIWHAAQPAKNSSGNVSSKEKAAITAQFFGCLSPTCKPLRMITQRAANPATLVAVGIAMPAIDIVSGVGGGSALIASGSLSS